MSGNPYLRAVSAIAAAAAVVLQTMYPGAAWARVVILAVTAYLGALQGAPAAKRGARNLVEWLMKGTAP